MDSHFADDPYAEEPDIDNPLIRRPDTSLFGRLKRGETLHVLAMPANLRFFIVPEQVFGCWIGYTVKYEDGTVSPQHNRILLDDDRVRDWCEHLVEIPAEE